MVCIGKEEGTDIVNDVVIYLGPSARFKEVLTSPPRFVSHCLQFTNPPMSQFVSILLALYPDYKVEQIFVRDY